MSHAIGNLLTIIFCAGGLGLVLFAIIVARVELEQRRETAGPARRRNRRPRR